MFKEWTKGQAVVFCTLALTCLITNMVYSIQAPIFPDEAHKKNATSAEYGLVFGIFQLTQMFASPLIASLSHYGGVTNTFVLGILLTGLSTVAFGFLKYIATHWIFIASALLLRTIEAIGTSAIWVGVYTFVVIEFPSSFASTTGTLEGFNGLALTIGPFFGSILYHFGGFLLPFAVTGGLLMVTGALVYFVLKGRDTLDVSTASETHETGTLTLLVALPSISMYMFNVIIAAVNMTFLMTLLEAYLHEFHVTPLVVGVVFLLNGLSNVVTAPIVSHLCGLLRLPELILVSGLFLSIAGFGLLAPIPIFTSAPELWSTLVGVGLIGCGAGCAFSPCFILSVQSAETAGLVSSSTTSLISGLWLSAFAFGAFVGPITAGLLNHHFGFGFVAMSLVYLDLAQVIMICVFMVCKRVKSAKHLSRPVVLE